LRFASLGSGSKGNCTIIDSGQSRILIDCGFNRKHTLLRLQQLEVVPESIAAVFVTHEHSDHAKGVVHFCESYNIPFYATYGTAKQAGWRDHALWKCVDSHEIIKLNDLSIKPVTVPHDSLEPVQFVVSTIKWQVGVLSDLGCLTPHVIEEYSGCHGLMMEANHDVDMLQQGPYPPSLKRRVGGDYGHLSNHQAAALLARLIGPQLKHVMATHVSEKNNSIAHVKAAFAQALNCDHEAVDVADQTSVSGWRELASE